MTEQLQTQWVKQQKGSVLYVSDVDDAKKKSEDTAASETDSEHSTTSPVF